MKRFLFAALAIVVTSVSTTAGESTLKTNEQKIGYAIGTVMSQKLGPVAKHLDKDALIQGLTDGISGTAPRLSEEEIQAALDSFNNIIQEEAKASAAQKGKFLEENKTKPGVQTTASGLQYKVIKEGTGAAPKPTDTVTVHYRGTLVSGTEFDSSYKRGEPATFPVNGVIPGWTEALQLMSIGDKWRITVPPGLAYGAQGKGAIPPNAVLIFEVELLAIK